MAYTVLFLLFPWRSPFLFCFVFGDCVDFFYGAIISPTIYRISSLQSSMWEGFFFVRLCVWRMRSLFHLISVFRIQILILAMWKIACVKLTMMPVLTAMPLPQYVLGTMSPNPTERNVIAISLLQALTNKTHGKMFGVNQLKMGMFCLDANEFCFVCILKVFFLLCYAMLYAMLVCLFV